MPTAKAKYGSLPSNAAMSIDIEDWFHSEHLGSVIDRASWDSCELRVDRNVDRMLTQMAHQGVKGTCFLLGWCAEKNPRLVKRIAGAGHEIASHGHAHARAPEQKPHEFKGDVERSKKFLEDLTGRAVKGYRAPAFAITDWAIDVLQSLGFEYDSSVRIGAARDGRDTLRGLSAGDPVVEIRKGFHEICVSCVTFAGRSFPGGGGHFRLLPYTFFRAGVRRVLRDGAPYVFYFRPWEIDPRHPRVGGLRRSDAFRHYANISSGEKRFNNLLRDFNWTTMEDLLSRWKPASRGGKDHPSGGARDSRTATGVASSTR
ncbi:MAG: DUF3473 domain-containing protein [Phycisphaerales bacterium]|nr:DUF3473 domain-containing protein [Phycisphaerales bacterium]